MEERKIAGISVHATTTDEAMKKVYRWIESDRAFLIFTPNPEIIVYAYRNRVYAQTLEKADLRLPDGRGLLFFGDFKERITGADFSEKIVAYCEKKGIKVACVIRADGKSSKEQLSTALKEKFPDLSAIVVAAQKKENGGNDALEQLQSFQPTVVLVGIGFPEQEIWLEKNRKKIPSMRIGMAVGGTFDFWTGAATRAPRFMRKYGIEWIYRFLKQPTRYARIARALFVFPVIAFFSRRKKK